MSVDIEHTTIFQRSHDGVQIDGIKVIGISLTTISTNDHDSFFTVSVHTEKSDLDPAHSQIVTIDHEMLAAMMAVLK